MSISSDITRIKGAKADLKTAINAKGGTLTTELIDEYPAAVDALPTGTDTSSATATASDILTGKTAYISDGTEATGTYEPLDTSSGDAVPADIALGKKAWVDGAELTGTNTNPDTSDATATAADIAFGKTAYIADGTSETGEMYGVKITEMDAFYKPTKVVVFGETIWSNAFNSAGSGNGSWDALAEISCPDATVGYDFSFRALPALTSLSLPELTSAPSGSFIYQNPKITTLSIPKLTTAPTYTAYGNTALTDLSLPRVVFSSGTNPLGGNPSLTTCQLGSIGYAVTALSGTTFSNMTQEGLTITIYVTPDTQPLANSPWGATNATIVYRSAVDGSVL
jgi:hypothetical protein